VVKRIQGVVAARQALRLTLFVLLAFLLYGQHSTSAESSHARGHPCGIRLAIVRERRPTDRPTVSELPYAAGADPKSVTGPDSLRLVDVNDSEHHPRVFIEDRKTGARDDIVGTSASRPAWSPNGRFVACLAYQPEDQASELTVVDRRTRKRVVNDLGVSADEYRWSPDSRWIAVDGVEKGTNHVVLSVYDVTRGRRTRLASTSAFGSFGLSWSPDSRLLAFTKPTAVDEDETILAADMWIAQPSGGLPCRIRATPTEIESRPEWISNTAVLLTSVPSSDPHGAGRQLVFELDR